MNRYLIEEIVKAAPPQQVLAEHLAHLLQQSKANIYKKINGITPFSAAEVALLARHYNISLDQHIHDGQGDFQKITFDYSLPVHQERSPANFLQKIRNDLERIVRLPNPKIVYASNELPLFHSLACRQLTAFKLYVWSRTNWKIPQAMNTHFDADAFYAAWPEMEEHRQAIVALYQQIPGKEYWPRTILDNVLNQIRYYQAAGLFSDLHTPALLKKELLDMLDQRCQMAAEERKSIAATIDAPVSFSLFFNEIAYTNNIILIYCAEQPVASYVTMDNPNFMRSGSPLFCQRMHQWMRQIEECSFHTNNESHRLTLFGHLKNRIEVS